MQLPALVFINNENPSDVFIIQINIVDPTES